MTRKLLSLFLILLLLCSCSKENELNAESKYTHESLSSDSVSENINTAVVSEITSETTTDILSPCELSKKELVIILQALIEKNESELWRISYRKDRDTYLNNVNFESYNILNSSSWQRDDKALISEYLVELVVSKSTDDRFPIGKSTWKVGFINNNIWYMLPQEYNSPYLHENIRINPYAELGFMFSYAFPFETITDLKTLPYIYSEKDFSSYLQKFILGISPEFKAGAERGAYGKYNYSVERINKIIGDYLGIEDYVWSDDFTGFSGILGETIMISDFVIINEQTDEYIDMTYFADYVYLTPAKKMRYYFKQNGDNIQLTGTELLKDYGYEPNWGLY